MGNCGAAARRRAAAAKAAASNNLANRRMGTAAAASSNEIAFGPADPDLAGSAYSAGGLAMSGQSNDFIYAMQCPQGIDQDVAMLATAAALAVGIYVVYRHENPILFLKKQGDQKCTFFKIKWAFLKAFWLLFFTSGHPVEKANSFKQTLNIS